MKSPNTFVVKPDWSSLKTENGLVLGEEVYERAEDMPVHLYPTQGEIVTSPSNYQIKKGSTLYFTWNAVSFNKCVSPIEKENLFALNLAWFAYREDGILKTTDDYFLLNPVKSQIKISESGLVLSGFQVSGSFDSSQVEESEEDEALVGTIAIMPEKSHGLKIGDKVCITSNSDVKVKIDGQTFYRTRASEMVFKYE